MRQGRFKHELQGLLVPIFLLDTRDAKERHLFYFLFIIWMDSKCTLPQFDLFVDNCTLAGNQLGKFE